MNATASEEATVFAPWPVFEPDEIEAAADVLKSGRVNYWTGSEGRQFEEEFADFAGTRYAIALANGTVALEAAFEALGIGPGDEVILTPRTFLASASAVVRVGAIPVFADVDRRSGNFDLDSVEAAITPKTRAILAVHLAGWPCDMPRLMEIAAAKGIHVVEDCAHRKLADQLGQATHVIDVIVRDQHVVQLGQAVATRGRNDALCAVGILGTEIRWPSGVDQQRPLLRRDV